MMLTSVSPAPVSHIPPADKSLLIVDDDRAFLTRLVRAMEARGYVVTAAESVAEGLAAIDREAPSRAPRPGRRRAPSNRISSANSGVH